MATAVVIAIIFVIVMKTDSRSHDIYAHMSFGYKPTTLKILAWQ